MSHALVIAGGESAEHGSAAHAARSKRGSAAHAALHRDRFRVALWEMNEGTEGNEVVNRYAASGNRFTTSLPQPARYNDSVSRSLRLPDV